jgi:co-chaperonin GroES (HSP10)
MIPLDNRVLVQRAKPEPSTIFLTDAEPSQLAVVIATGPGKLRSNGTRRPMGVKKGDVVLVPGCANQFPDWSEGERILITEDDIAGIVTQEAN